MTFLRVLYRSFVRKHHWFFPHSHYRLLNYLYHLLPEVGRIVVCTSDLFGKCESDQKGHEAMYQDRQGNRSIEEKEYSVRERQLIAQSLTKQAAYVGFHRFEYFLFANLDDVCSLLKLIRLSFYGKDSALRFLLRGDNDDCLHHSSHGLGKCRKYQYHWCKLNYNKTCLFFFCWKKWWWRIYFLKAGI